MNDIENDLVGMIDSLGENPIDMSAHARATAIIDEARDFKITFGSETGRRCLNAILKHCGFLDTKVAKLPNGGVDANGTMVLVGMSNVATYIMNRRQLDIGKYEKMLKQAAQTEGAQP